MRYLNFLEDLIKDSSLLSSNILVISRAIASFNLPSYFGTYFLINLYLIVKLLAYLLT